MIYSHAYRRFYPVQFAVDVAMLEDIDRRKLAKCVSRLSRNMTAWIIESMRHKKLDKKEDYNFGGSLDALGKECAGIADKIMSGVVLTEKEMKFVNIALCADKYSWILSCFILSPESHLMRISNCAKEFEKESYI